MSSSAFDPQGADGARRLDPAEAGSSEGRPYDRALLERVLQETLTDDDLRETLTGVDKAALLEVAARYRNQPLSLDPVVVALVRAMLRTHFEALPGSEDLWRTISGEIGQTLWDNPAVRLRLEAFWRHLCEVKP